MVVMSVYCAIKKMTLLRKREWCRCVPKGAFTSSIYTVINRNFDYLHCSSNF
jgi:hypothetical protein